MGKNQERALVGVFSAADDARQAIVDLRNAGVSDKKISVVLKDANGDPDVRKFRDLQGNRGGAGAAGGAVAGALAGALWALGVSTGHLPDIGEVPGADNLGALAASAGIGAGTGALLGALVGRGVNDEKTAYYREELRRGRTIVLVEDEARSELVRTIFRGHDAESHELMTPAEAEHVRRDHGVANPQLGSLRTRTT